MRWREDGRQRSKRLRVEAEDGDDVIIAGSVSDEQAKEQYPEGWESPKP